MIQQPKRARSPSPPAKRMIRDDFPTQKELLELKTNANIEVSDSEVPSAKRPKKINKKPTPPPPKRLKWQEYNAHKGKQ